MRTNRSSLIGSIILLLFSLPFACVGLAMLGWIWNIVWSSHVALQSWQEVPSTIQTVKLESRRGSKGGVSYEVTGSYSYEFGGQSHLSNRLTFDSGSDNIGDFTQSLYQELQAAKKTGEPLTCRVNPAHPDEAVLKPAWRPEMVMFKSLFSILFGGIGVGMFAMSALAIRQEWGERSLRKEHPAEPWRWRRGWRSKTIPSKLAPVAFAGGLAVFLINASTAPLWTALPDAWSKGGGLRWVILAALALAVVATVFCLRPFLRWLRFRGACLEIVHAPITPGGSCLARLVLPRELPAGARVEFVLKCIHRVTTGSGKRSRTTTTELWKHQATATDGIRPARTVEFSCVIPADQPGTLNDDPAVTILWELTATADIPGVDLKVDFELPVFAAAKAV